MSLLSHYHPRVRREKPTSSICYPGSSSRLQGQSSRRAFVPFHLGLWQQCVPWGEHQRDSFRVAGWEMGADIWDREKLKLLRHLSPWDQAKKHLFPALASPCLLVYVQLMFTLRLCRRERHSSAWKLRDPDKLGGI